MIPCIGGPLDGHAVNDYGLAFRRPVSFTCESIYVKRYIGGHVVYGEQSLNDHDLMAMLLDNYNDKASL